MAVLLCVLVPVMTPDLLCPVYRKQFFKEFFDLLIVDLALPSKGRSSLFEGHTDIRCQLCGEHRKSATNPYCNQIFCVFWYLLVTIKENQYFKEGHVKPLPEHQNKGEHP